MESKLVKYWKAIDLFGVAPVLSFQGRGKSTTFFGGVFSILMVAYICLAAIYSFQNMVFRLNPNTVVSSDIGRTSGNIVSKDHFNAGFSFVNTYTGDFLTDPAIIQPQFFKFLLPVADLEGNIQRAPELIPLPTEMCTEDHFAGRFSTVGFCMGIDVEEEITTVEDQIIFVQFNRCNNATSSVTCASKEQQDLVLNTYQMMVTYPGLFIDPNNYDTPITIKREHFVVRSSATLSKQLRLSLQEYEFQTDSGFLINDVSSETHIGVERLWTDISEDGKNDLTAIIYMNGRKENHQRSYMKLQQALAGTVALIRVAFLACAILVVPCTKVKYYHELIEDLFTFRKAGVAGARRIIPMKTQFHLKGQSESHTRLHGADEHDLSQSSVLALKKVSNEETDRPFNSDTPANRARKQAANSNNVSMRDQDSVMLDVSTPSPLKHRSISPTHAHEVNGNNLSPTFNVEDGGEKIQPADIREVNESQEAKEDEQDNKHNISVDPQRDYKEAEEIAKERRHKSSSDEEHVCELPSPNIDSPIVKRKLTPARIMIPQNQSVTKDEEKLQQVVQRRKQREPSKLSNDFAVFAWMKKSIPFHKSHEKLQYKAGKEKITSELCITRIMKKMRELDRLKALLLTEDQRVLFDNLPKPDILGPLDIPNDMERKFEEEGKKKVTDQEYLKGLAQYYFALKGKSEKSKIDRKLLDWFETGDY